MTTVASASPKPPLPPSDRKIWLDGRLVPWDSVTVHVLSHSMQRASLIFDFMSVHETPRGPAVFRMPEHVRRLLRSAELLGLPLRLTEAEICAAVVETVRANPGSTCAKVCAYLPSIEVEVVPMDDRMSVCVAAYDAARDVIARNAGRPHVAPELRLHLDRERQKMRPEILPPAAKVSANYTSPMVAKWAARRAGYDEILLVDEKGFVAEASTENVFLVDRDGTLRTPSLEYVLPGVTRDAILQIAKHDGRPTVEGSIRPEELFTASEVFLTATSAGVWPVISIDRKPVGEGSHLGRTGPVSLALKARFQEVTSGRVPDFDAWLRYVNEG
ncbi:MAG TPA: aminotransferase class IV [Myxococcota bacterium]|jgi:branched-chain amino acid aminotransferase|nr:aminotransferase class IV [Myxococcota bacterium]